MSDIDQLLALTALAGPGFTGLPRDRDTMRSRIELSQASFNRLVEPQYGWYTLVIEEATDGSLLGLASVKARIGLHEPHYSLRISNPSGISNENLDPAANASLMLVTECCGHTEVGSLFVSPNARGQGAGKLLSRARYVLIALHQELFADIIMAELRGVFDKGGCSPFWDGYAARYLPMTFAEANNMVINGDFEKLASYLPAEPVPIQHLGQKARSTVGMVHFEGQAAWAMLKREGFDHSGLVDVLDAGPTLTCKRSALKTVENLRISEVQICADSGTARPTIMANPCLDHFAVLEADAAFLNNMVRTKSEVLELLGINEKDKVGVL